MSRRRRLRRLCAFCAHRQESAFLQTDGNWRRFVEAYCTTAGLAPEWMLERIARRLNAVGVPE